MSFRRWKSGGRAVRVNLQGINQTRKRLADGTIRIYFYDRATGHRLRGEPGSPEFMASMAEADKLRTGRLDGLLSGLIREFLNAPEFERGRAESTRREYRRMLGRVEAEFGTMPLSAVNDPDVRREFLNWRDKVARSSGLREADNRMSALSALLSWGVERRAIAANHILGASRLYKSNRSEIVWLPEHVDAFMRVAPIELQRALILALHTGQRQGDLLRLVWSQYDGARIRLRQGKARRGDTPGRLLEIPCTAALRRVLDNMPRVGAVILTTKTGRPWRKRYFASQWAEVMAKAGLDKIELPGFDSPVELHFHDLRGTAVTMLAEAGCSVPEICAVTGHSLKTATGILETYLARTRALADQAIFRFENAPTTKFANRLQTGGSKTSEGGAK